MRVLLTGGTGFLGNHLAKRLAQEHELRVLCRGPRNLAGGEAVTGDVMDRASLVAAMEGCHAVVHAAGGVSHKLDDAGEVGRVHLEGTENVLEAAKESKVLFFLHMSTSGTIGVSEKDKVFDESAEAPTDLIYRWPYYRAKHFAERLVLEKHGRLRVATLNPSLLLGPGDATGSSVRPVQLFLEGRLPGTPCGGLSFVDVRDVAEAAALALKKGKPGRRYLLGSANMSFATFYARLSRISGVETPSLRMPSLTRRLVPMLPARGMDLPWFMGQSLDRIDLELASHFWYINSARAREELGWSPRDPNETLRDTVADLLGDRYSPNRLY